MKRMLFVICMVMVVGCLASCTAREDLSLREKYIDKVGLPVSKETLQNAITVTQPFPNKDGEVKGDQYVVIKNSRPDIGGVWHLGWAGGEKTIGTDNDTIVYESNGTFQIYYTGISANTRIATDPITITVTNVFDQWSGYITGAKDKADITAEKKWKFRNVTWGSVCNMGAYGGWKYTSAGYVPESNFMWWANVTEAMVSNLYMTFQFNGNKLLVYNADGSLASEGSYAFNHTVADQGVLGELITSKPIIGASYDDCGQNGASNKFWILTLNEDYLTIFHPVKYTGGVDWDDYGWYAYFKAED
jgi:hypothetical protein